MAASPSPLPVLLPDPARVSVERVQLAEDVVVIVAGATGETATCPICGSSSCHVHSQYSRTLLDLSWQAARVRIELNARASVADRGIVIARYSRRNFPAAPWRRDARPIAIVNY